MFTGIIKYVLNGMLKTSILCVYCSEDFITDVGLGDSIAINGVCMTVFEIASDHLKFFIMKETMDKTTFGSGSGSINNTNGIFNVEKSLKKGEEIGGHIVQGHVHGMGKVVQIILNDDNSLDFWIEYDGQTNIKYKDSVAVDGISLTISEVCNNRLRVSIIPYTIENTNLCKIIEGSYVNLEYNIVNQIEENYTYASDEYFMNIALAESEKGRRTAPPNPWVGAVIVKNNIIIGKGYHHKAGLPHAEANAINDAVNNGNGSMIKGSKIYVTLEPCHHFEGKSTPPCDELITGYEISEVIIGIADPDARINNSGIAHLKKCHINVRVGILENKITESLKPYLFHRKTGLPYTIIKIATTMDGYPCMENGNSKWITGNEAMAHVHKIRSESQAIMVGCNTILNDDPSLTVRFGYSNKPRRVFLDYGGKVNNIELKIFNTEAPTLAITSNNAKKETLEIWSKYINYEIVDGSDGKIDLLSVLKILGSKGVLQLIIEGGPTLHSDVLDKNLAQEIHMYRGNIIFGSAGKKWINNYHAKITDCSRYQLEEVLKIGNDIFSRYIIIENKSGNKIEQALQILREGRPIILMDSESREDEGDLVIGAEFVTKEWMTFFIKNSTGIVCVPMEESRAKRLKLPKMTAQNEDMNQTPFTVSCDYAKCRTGVSADERAQTILALASDESVSTDFTRPGHIFPLVASIAGLYDRAGHTEGSVELCKLAGIKPVAAIAELMTDNGDMMRYADCQNFAAKNNLLVVTIDELKDYIKNNLKNTIRPLSSCELVLGNNLGKWELVCYNSGDQSDPHKILIKGDIWSTSEPILTRVHSECFTGDVLGSLLCDCGEQLHRSLDLISTKGTGIIILPARHEGRGIGLINKIRAYKIIKKSSGMINTYEANKLLGFGEDERDFGSVRHILDDLQIKKICLMTENPNKIEQLKDKIAGTIPIKCTPNKYNFNYLKIKSITHNIEDTMTTVQNKIEPVNEYLDTKLLDSTNKIAIISTMWNKDIIDDYRNELINDLRNLGVSQIDEYHVPGSFEIPYVANKLVDKNIHNIIICLGVVIKGETAHFEYISDAVIHGLMKIQIERKIPIINGVLNVYERDQAISRCSKTSGLSHSLALSTVNMLNLQI